MSPRVVAGAHNGRRLAAPRGAATRPTADRVREALFNLLGPVEGLRAIDLYAGSGAFGIEALSRGAAEVTLVDSDAAAVRVIRENLDRIREEEPKIVRSDASSFLRAAARRGEHWDLAFCDPPYRLAPRLGAELGRLLPAVLEPQARVACESSSRQPLVLALPLQKERRYGDTLISIYLAHQQEDR
jgi:16S rRNA (guanine966-N2)-methyltransferase